MNSQPNLGTFRTNTALYFAFSTYFGDINDIFPYRKAMQYNSNKSQRRCTFR